MAHVHGSGKPRVIPMAQAMGPGMADMSVEHMMGRETAAMMQGSLAAQTMSSVKSAAAAGVVVAATNKTGVSLMSRIFKHPLVVFSLGVAAGYYAHKYRKEIIDAATRAAEKSKDFVLQQRENLEDLVAESRENEG